MTAMFSSSTPSFTPAHSEAHAIPAAVILKIAHRTLKRAFEGDRRALQETHSSVKQWLVKHGYVVESHEYGTVTYYPTPKARRALMVA